jgi:hypothetical protein
MENRTPRTPGWTWALVGYAALAIGLGLAELALTSDRKTKEPTTAPAPRRIRRYVGPRTLARMRAKEG